ncbi:prephenate dehydratase [Corynebacterium ammoniagenes]|jgi:prephenate dehydratase|uniref:Prephenate dehydratase n=2 Tax=Corynebacterium ammoniagenes TaxID=1697 RepID=A0AAV5G895_CORAM|nr:prephenate dehydratase [Corynebacterium ammoniagenes]APT83581.1 prephenate dehydratase [Corynebacterium ammoniagenes DSM 20306]AQS74574.1 prephenate dehydratase [Corynebacterium ammoniagenes]EFG81212.1 prephenate dehydratase [Corynebacterium ammoniagenes DSM 20306]NMF32023.1 prephenate dehydratase [Corynebacterium ammoniagenes]GJN43266.1 prephenate dehydratase [Corynebacterium ammoniagenes]
MTSTVAFLGPAGTFTEAALVAFENMGAVSDVTQLPVNSPSEAFQAVREGRADFACVAIENSVDGAVTTTFDAFTEGEALQVYQEVDLEVAFAIMVKKGISLDDVSTIATHPVAYQQVRGWLAENIPDVKFQPASSNGAAAELVARGEVDAAAAPERAAEIFDLDVVASSVADVQGATTRFVLVGAPGKPTPRTGTDRTSVVFTVPHEPGSLASILQEFAYRNLDMLRIESRPTRKKFGTYRFFVDLAGHIEDDPVAEALRALWLRTDDLRFIGSWPAAGQTGPQLDTTEFDNATAWVARVREGR